MLETLLDRFTKLGNRNSGAGERLQTGPDAGPRNANSQEGQLRDLFLQFEHIKCALQESAGNAIPAAAAGAAIPRDEGPVFMEPWEAKVFALVVLLNQRGHFTWAEWVQRFSAEIERAKSEGRPTHGPAYYTLWLAAAEKLLAAKGLLLKDEYARMKSAFALKHPHPSFVGLMQEHRTIEKVVEAFAQYARRLEKDRGTPAELLVFVDFLAEFAESEHHVKEEELLFQTMLAYGFPPDGAIAVMRAEHTQAAAYLGTLREAAAYPWNEVVKTDAARTIHRYVQLLKQHIAKEDRDLYPLAHARLPAKALAELDRACRKFDGARVDDHNRLMAIADDLEQRYAE